MGWKRILSNSKLLLIVTVAIFCLVAAPVAALAQDEGEEEDATSHFNNPTQAAKAQNLADISADMAADDEEAQNALAEAEGALDTATGEFNTADDAVTAVAEQLGIEKEDFKDLSEDDLNGLVEAGDITEDEKTAIQDYVEAEKNLESAQLDYAEALANATGVSVAEIAEMRATMGWGQICHELGIHPSALGNKFGHQNQFREKTKAAHGYGHGKKAGMLSSTTRDLKTGGAKSFGQSKAGKGSGSNNAGGLGQSKDKSNNGKGNSGKGNSDNNGKGKGKDK